MHTPPQVRSSGRPRLWKSSLVLSLAAAVCMVGAPWAAVQPATAAPVDFPDTVPMVQSWAPATGDGWRVSGTTSISVTEATRAAGELLAEGLLADYGFAAKITLDPARPGDITLALSAAPEVAAAEGYSLLITDRVEIAASGVSGLRHGATTLLQSLRTTPTPLSLPSGTVIDAPRMGDRGQMLDVGRRYFPVAYIQQQIDQMAWLKMNTLHLHLSDWNGYRIESASHPEIVSPESYTVAELKGLDAYAAARGITIVPEIDVPGHATEISRARPDLALTCPSMSQPNNNWEGTNVDGWTLDYTKPETRALVKDLIAELAETFSGPYIHIGGDEVPTQGAQNKCPSLVAAQAAKGFNYVGDLLVDFTNEMNAAVRSHGKTTQIWQWWDWDSPVTTGPDKNIIVNEWLSDPLARANSGYKTIGTQDGPLYVSAGFGSTPGSYAFFNVNTTYSNYAFASHENMLGYRVSRWSDKSYGLSNDFYDYLSRRPLAVVAERTWSDTKTTAATFLDRYEQIGDAPTGRTSLGTELGGNIGATGPAVSKLGWTTTATSQETAGENGSAANATDNTPYTMWHSKYSSPSSTLPQSLTVDLGNVQRLSGTKYLPRQDGGRGGRIKDYEVSVSKDGTTWTPAVEGTFDWYPTYDKSPGDKNWPMEWSEEIMPFTADVDARFVRLTALSSYVESYASVAEFNVIKAQATLTAPTTLNVVLADDADASKILPGQAVTVRVLDVQPGSSATLKLGSAELGSAVANSDGVVTFAVTIPADAKPGKATLTVTGTDKNGMETSGSLPVTLIDATTAPDTTAPTTTATIDKTPNAAGVYTSAPSVTLSATDDFGIQSTQYMLNSGVWKDYKAPVAIPEGATTFSYRSTDTSGNVEATKSLAEFKVHTAQKAPELSLLIDGSIPGTVKAGKSYEVTVGELLPGSAAELWLHSEPVLLTNLETTASGTATTTITIPAGTKVGAHNLVLRGLNAAGIKTEASFALTVTAGAKSDGGPTADGSVSDGSTPSSSTPSSSSPSKSTTPETGTSADLAHTGATMVPWLAGGIMVLLLGAALLVRRRPAGHGKL